MRKINEGEKSFLTVQAINPILQMCVCVCVCVCVCSCALYAELAVIIHLESSLRETQELADIFSLLSLNYSLRKHN